MVGSIDFTSVILGLITLLGGCGWVIDRKKYRQEVESLKADNRLKDMNLSRDYVTEFRTFIAEPLQREVGELRQEVTELRYAIQKIDTCAHRANCPVVNELQRKSAGE
jgi:hypothetical protein